MKKKLLSLILVLMLLPIASIFGACGKDKGYNLTNLNSEFFAIEEETNNIQFVDGQIGFNYKNHAKFCEVIENVYPYTELSAYNFVFENIMDFACSYVESCSDNSTTNDVKLKNEIKTNLNELKDAIAIVDSYTSMFIETITISNAENLEGDLCIIKFETLLQSYDKAFNAATNFNNSLSNLYFNYVLKDGNPNVFDKVDGNYALNKDLFDVNVVVNKLNARIAYQKSNLSECFAEQFINDGLAEDIATKETSLGYVDMTYRANINKINAQIDELYAVEKANANKENFYNLCVEAFNIIESINNDRAKFISACNEIEYVKVKNSEVKSAQEKMCLTIVDDFTDLVSSYNNVLAQIISIVGV